MVKEIKSKYIDFQEISDSEIGLYDKKGEYLASIERVRVGRWMSWCLTSVIDKKVYFSASCLDEIRIKIKELNKVKKKVWVPSHWSYYYDKYHKKRKKLVKGYWKVIEVSNRRWRW